MEDRTHAADLFYCAFLFVVCNPIPSLKVRAVTRCVVNFAICHTDCLLESVDVYCSAS